jgi:hypothetical protein
MGGARRLLINAHRRKIHCRMASGCGCDVINRERGRLTWYAAAELSAAPSLAAFSPEGGAMNRQRKTGRLTRIGGLTAMVVLSLASLAAVRADELSDLRADQQQLQLRLDQLSAPPAQGTAPAAPDRPPLIGGSFPRSFLIPGTNTSIRIGGSVQWNGAYGRW